MFLAIETSSLVSSVALLQGEKLRAELTIQAKLTHSEQLMPHIADMLVKAAAKKEDIDGVIVSAGPGSFTGLRIGLATAKALAFAWHVPIVGIETPLALAWNFVGVGDLICPLIDAQKGNVYYSLYRWRDGTVNEVHPVTIAPLTAVLQLLADEAVVFCGDGALLGAVQIGSTAAPFRIAPPTQVIPRAGSLALAGAFRLQRGDYDDAMTLVPSYKRRSEAEVLWEKRHGGAPCQ